MSVNRPVITFKYFLRSKPLSFLFVVIACSFTAPILFKIINIDKIKDTYLFWIIVLSIYAPIKAIILYIEYRTVQKICLQDKDIAVVKSSFLALSDNHLLIVDGLNYKLFPIKHIAKVESFSSYFIIHARVTRPNHPNIGPSKNFFMYYYFVDPFKYHFIDTNVEHILRKLKHDKRLERLSNRINKWWYESIPVHYRLTIPVLLLCIALRNFTSVVRFIRYFKNYL